MNKHERTLRVIDNSVNVTIMGMLPSRQRHTQALLSSIPQRQNLARTHVVRPLKIRVYVKIQKEDLLELRLDLQLPRNWPAKLMQNAGNALTNVYSHITGAKDAGC